MKASDLPPGTRLGAYRIERPLGEGGMGVVYLAEHISLSRMVALKVLASKLAEDHDFRKRFERESKLAASLDHPHIVPVFDAGEAEGLLYIAMRFIQGKDLGRLLEEEGRLEPERALSLVGQVADALDEAHAAGLVHRDVKPANIMLAPSRRGPDEHVYLTDFGLARQFASGTRLTRSGYFVGTIHYSSPEQFTGSDLDGRADVYSLGCVAFECLTGQVPFRREHEPAVMYAHLQEDPPRVTSLRPELPEAVDEAVATAMAKDREDRFPTCGQMVEFLSAALSGQAAPPTLAGPGTRPTAPGARVVATAPRAAATPGSAATTETITPPQPQPRPRRRARWPWVAAVAVVAAALVGGGAWLLAAGGRDPEASGPGQGSSPPASPASPSAPASPSSTPEPADVASGRFAGETEQGEEVGFVVKRSTISGEPRVRDVHFFVNHSGCFSAKGLGELISQEFEWGPLDEGIAPDGRFRFREESPEGTQVFEGAFSEPETATGTVSVRTTKDVASPCVTGSIPWSAALRG